jgi:hypothetical protein
VNDPNDMLPNISASSPPMAGLVNLDDETSLSPDSMIDVDDPEKSESAADGPEKPVPQNSVILLSRRGSGNSRTSSLSTPPDRHMHANGREGEEQNRRDHV